MPIIHGKVSNISSSRGTILGFTVDFWLLSSIHLILNNW